MPKKKALGRGLSALLDTETQNRPQTISSGTVFDIPLGQIQVNPFQPRTKFKEQLIEELAQSITGIGIVQPITVRKIGVNTFQIISGERRFRASKIAKLQSIPAYVRTANDREMLEMALVENIQREDLDSIEIALTYKRMSEELGMTQHEISQTVGKKRSTVTNYLRLLKLDPIIQSGIRDEMISMGHGRTLINIEDRGYQLDIYEQVIRSNLSVRQTEDLVRNFKDTDLEEPKRKSKTLPERIQNISKQIRSQFNTKVTIRQGTNGKGSILIYFKNEQELERIHSLMDNQ